jgi:hypothetical protein
MFKFDHIFISLYELQFLFFFQFFCLKSIFFESLKWTIIIHMDFVGFPFRTSKLKNNISYIKCNFSHSFGKVCRWLSMYYSKIIIITFFKITTVSISIILKILFKFIRTIISIIFEPLDCAFTLLSMKVLQKSMYSRLNGKFQHIF